MYTAHSETEAQATPAAGSQYSNDVETAFGRFDSEPGGEAMAADETIRIVVVDDDADVRDLLCDYLGDNGYEVASAASGSELREQLAVAAPRAVLLDISLPGEDGLSLARYLRQNHDLGIVMVSGAGETVDRIIGLEVGADDYISKPFDLRELRARLKSVIRRYPGDAAAASKRASEDESRRVAFGAMQIDLDRAQLFSAEGHEVPLTASEFELCKVFLERPNRPLSRDQLMALTRNRDWDPYDRSIDIRIARLRKKIEPNPERPQTIVTKRGLGYMYVPGD